MNNFKIQDWYCRAKLGIGLLSGKYSDPSDTNNEHESRQGIPPRMFKTLVGRGHPGFSSNRQQDAQEFFLHIINIINVMIKVINAYLKEYASDLRYL